MVLNTTLYLIGGILLTFLIIKNRKIIDLYWTIYQIPGPPPSKFFLTNALEFFESPEKAFACNLKWAEKYYPLYKIYVGYNITITLLHPQDIEMVLSNPLHMRKALAYKMLENWLGTGLLTSTGEKWRIRRKILTPIFHFKILKEFCTIFNHCAEKFVKRVNTITDIQPQVAQFSLEAFAETAMGVKLSEDDLNNTIYKKSVLEIGEILMQRLLRPWYHFNAIYQWTKQAQRENHLVRILHEFTQNVIKSRQDLRVTNHNTMLDVLLLANKNNLIEHVGIREEVDTLLFEAHDTTSTNLMFLLLLLANHNQVQERLQIECDSLPTPPTFHDLNRATYLNCCIRECLRLYPSVPFISRILGSEVRTVNGYRLPAGTTVTIDIFNLHRNPELYPEPNRFRPERFLDTDNSTIGTERRNPYAYIPFSAGVRNCIGQKMALLQMKCVLVALLKQYHLVPIDTVGSVVLKSDFILRSKNQIRIKFVSRT